MTGDVLLALSEAVPTLTVFIAAWAFFRTRRENDALREEVELLRRRLHAEEAGRWERRQEGEVASGAYDGD